MRWTAWLSPFVLAGALALGAQNPSEQMVGGAPEGVTDPIFLCPMDPEVRSHDPGKCPRCGMKLVTGIPDPVAFDLELRMTPKPPKPLDKARVNFVVRDPWKGEPVTRFQLVHEKLFHAFFISQDLQFFVHDHPVQEEDTFRYDITFPQPGMYRVLGDFYPDGATPQLIAKTLIVPGTPPKPVTLARDYTAKTAENLTVEFSTDPPQPLAAQKTRLLFRLNPADGFEKYLGAWGHMLAASDDLIDLSHQHPFIAEGGADVQFNMVFARPRMYRVWVQFQRLGTVNTVHFDIPVRELQ